MIKRLHRHILQAFLGPFLLALATLSFILVSQFMVMYLRKITGTGISPGNFFLLWVFTLGRVMITVVPMAVLAAGVMTFGNLAEQHELTAGKSSGISLWRMMRPLWIGALALLACMYYATFVLIPDANYRFQKIIFGLTETTPEMVFQPGYFHSEIEGFVIWITDKDVETGMLYDVMVYDHSQDQEIAQVMMADSAKAYLVANQAALKLTLFHGSRHESYPGSDEESSFLPYGRAYFDSLYVHLDLTAFQSQKEAQLRHRNTLRMGQLKRAIDSLVAEKNMRLETYISVMGQQNLVDSTLIAPDFQSEPSQNLASFFTHRRGMEEEHSKGEERKNRYEQLKRSIRSNLEYLRIVTPQYEFNKQQLRKYEYEYFSRMAAPLNVVFFMLIGLSFGSLVRKGGLGVPALAATVVFVLYYFAISQGEKLTKMEVITPWAGAWIPVWIFTALAIAVTYMAIQESKWGDLFRGRINFTLPFIKTNQQGRKKNEIAEHGNSQGKGSE